MRHRIRAGLVAALCTLAYAVAPADAQERPDFAGRWTEAPDSAAAGGRGARAGSMGSGWGSPLTITQDATSLTLQYAFFTRGDMQPPLKFVYSLNGDETKNTVMMGHGIQEQLSKTAWQGTSFVITTTHHFTNPATGRSVPAQVTHTLSLESPATLIVTTTRAGVLGGAASTTRTRYTKS